MNMEVAISQLSCVPHLSLPNFPGFFACEVILKISESVTAQ